MVTLHWLFLIHTFELLVTSIPEDVEALNHIYIYKLNNIIFQVASNVQITDEALQSNGSLLSSQFYVLSGVGADTGTLKFILCSLS